MRCAFALMLFLVPGLVAGQSASVKLEPCKISWKPVQDSDLAKYRIDILDSNNSVVESKEFPPSVTEVKCSDLFKEGDSRKLNFYAIDGSDNVSDGLMDLKILIIDSTPPAAIEEACIEGVNADDQPVKACVPVTSSSTIFKWKAPTANVDGTDLTDLGGYKLYSGPSSREYSWHVDVGDTTMHAVQINDIDEQRYFAVTAYDDDGNESEYSNEVRLPKGTIPEKISFYVAYDARANPYPEWLRDDYVDTHKVVMTTDVPYRIWGSDDQLGHVSIPGNLYGNPRGVSANYFVLFDGNINNLVPVNYQVDTFSIGAKLYIDRDYEVTLVPKGFDNYKIIQMANNDKGIETPAHIQFDLIQ